MINYTYFNIQYSISLCTCGLGIIPAFCFFFLFSFDRLVQNHIVHVHVDRSTVDWTRWRMPRIGILGQLQGLFGGWSSKSRIDRRDVLLGVSLVYGNTASSLTIPQSRHTQLSLTSIDLRCIRLAGSYIIDGVVPQGYVVVGVCHAAIMHKSLVIGIQVIYFVDNLIHWWQRDRAEDFWQVDCSIHTTKSSTGHIIKRPA